MDNEFKILSDKLDKFIKETRKNFGSVNDDLNTFEGKQEDVFRKLGELENEVYLLKDRVENQTKAVKKSTDELKEDIAGSTKVVIKEVDKAKKRWWQRWVKRGGENK